MPTIRVELFAGRTIEQKRAFAKALTEAAVATIGSSAESVDVIFTDVNKEDWASGGVLWSDKLGSAGQASARLAKAGKAGAAPAKSKTGKAKAKSGKAKAK